MTLPEDFHFDAFGLRLAGWRRVGQGRPVLALHGWLDNANSFLPLQAHVPAPLMALDFAGHGYSDHRPAAAATHLIDNVRDVHAAVRLHDDQPVDIVGHSMGAGIACLYAASFPERVRRLVLIEGLGPLSTPGDGAPAVLREAVEDMLSLPDKTMPVYADPEDAVEARTGGFGGLDRESARLLCERGLHQVPGGWSWRSDPRLRLRSTLRLTEEQVEGFLRAIRCPVLLIRAEQGMGGQGMFDHRVDWMENLTLVSLAGRHHLHMETPEPVAEQINAFLAGQETDQN
jgi:pimeloyl-ACP methyl ester carboxylesterase